MNSKTERFELRLDPVILERVDEWRARQNNLPSRAESIRRLVDTGLTHSNPGELHPNATERLVLWMLSELLLHQKGRGTNEDIVLIQEAIYGGHFWALEYDLPSIVTSHIDSRPDVREVYDILEMWHFIEYSHKKLSAVEKRRLEKEAGLWGKEAKFAGFYGNSEGKHLSIARFLVEKFGRFPELRGRDLNSHREVLHDYRMMLSLYEPMMRDRMGRELNLSELTQILTVRPIEK